METFFESGNEKKDYVRQAIMYSNGAYVLHLLREKLGDEQFWKAIKSYTTTYFDKSVTTDDFQKAVEKSTGTDLGDFFTEWVYMGGR